TTLLYSCGHFHCSRLTDSTTLNTLSLHDALPISHHEHARPSRGRLAAPLRHGARHVRAARRRRRAHRGAGRGPRARGDSADVRIDRKSTRLNSSHVKISYAVFCLKKKKTGK